MVFLFYIISGRCSKVKTFS